MSQEQEQDFDPNFTIDITAEQMATVRPFDGAGFQLAPFGDFTYEITDVRPHVPENKADPKVSTKVQFTVVVDLTGKHPEALGMQIDNYYGTAPNAHRVSKARFAQLLNAIGAKLQPGKPFAPRAALMGQRIDGTVIHELGDERIDQETSARKRYTNARLIAERPVGQARPPHINPEAMSARATKYREQSFGGAADEGTDSAGVDAPPWGAQGGDAAPDASNIGPKFTPEEQMSIEDKPSVHAYRAMIKLDPDNAQAHRDVIANAGYDPDGPVDPSVLDEPTKAAWIKLVQPAPAALPKAPTGLPKPPSVPVNGGATKPAVAPQRTGQRAPRA